MKVRPVDPGTFGVMVQPQPGDIWLAPYMFDPKSRLAVGLIRYNLELITPETREKAYLSHYYWRQHASLRPPIMVVCPDGTQWCVDARSTSGFGWEVTGEFPNITCVPEMDCRPRGTYYGRLTSGVFSDPLA